MTGLMRFAIAAAIFGGFFIAAPAAALDHGFDPNSPITQWFDTLMRPDMPANRCCGVSDAYRVEVIEQGGEDGSGPNWIVKIADGSAITFPDGKTRTAIPDGTIIHVPAAKVTKASQSNPTKSAWLFVYINEWIKGADDMPVRTDDPSQHSVSTIYCLVPLPPSF
ncbi:MAG: hypothetical protein ABSA68_13400 [Xanthobacteraceae bacterium]|jgi:hypothetical protein